MNIVLQYLRMNWKRLGLEGFGSEPGLSCVLATPRFRASNHVIFFIFADDVPKPILIAKVPRLPGESKSLDREASNLREILVYRPDGLASIPRVVAYEEFQDNRILIENALTGHPMTLSLVRQNHRDFIEAVMVWLIEFHIATKESSQNHSGWYNRLVVRPWNQFVKAMPLNGEEQGLIDATRNLADMLKHAEMGLVFEHRDLGHPNILLCQDGTIGVVDWELAEPRGLPAVDLFFFLTLVSFSKQHAKTNADYLAAFHNAFFGQDAWAKPFIARYVLELNISPEILNLLFVLCWSRYLTNMVKRLSEHRNNEYILSDETVAWLRANRYFALWRYAIQHYQELNLVN
jgi:aminoglycoside phosphotransferase